MSKIITLDDLKEYIGTELDNENRATLICESINEWIEAYTGRVWGETKTFTDTLDYEPVVFLSHIDITKVSEVKTFGNIETGYRVDKTTGRLLLNAYGERKYSRGDFDQVEVTYTTGVEVVPSLLKTTALQLASDNYNRQDGKDANVASESVGGYSVTYGATNSLLNGSNGSSNGVSNAINSVMAVLNYYRLRRL